MTKREIADLKQKVTTQNIHSSLLDLELATVLIAFDIFLSMRLHIYPMDTMLEIILYIVGTNILISRAINFFIKLKIKRLIKKELSYEEALEELDLI